MVGISIKTLSADNQACPALVNAQIDTNLYITKMYGAVILQTAPYLTLMPFKKLNSDSEIPPHRPHLHRPDL
jgi:hypothetical protein